MNNYIQALRDTVKCLNNKQTKLSTKARIVKDIIEKSVYIDRMAVVTFAKDSYVLSQEAQETLTQFIKSGIKKVDIIAYASPEGGKEYNINLSKNRANAVAEYLKIVDSKGLGANSKESNRIAIVVAQ